MSCLPACVSDRCSLPSLIPATRPAPHTHRSPSHVHASWMGPAVTQGHGGDGAAEAPSPFTVLRTSSRLLHRLASALHNTQLGAGRTLTQLTQSRGGNEVGREGRRKRDAITLTDQALPFKLASVGLIRALEIKMRGFGT